MTEESSNTRFEAFKVLVGTAPFSITNAKYEHSADGDGVMRDWLVLEGRANDNGVSGTVKIELPAVVALAGFTVSEKANTVRGTAADELEKLASEFADALEQVTERFPNAVKAGWEAFAKTLKGSPQKKAS